MFNEGYAATSGDSLVRDDVAGEAIRLVSLLALTASPVVAMNRAVAISRLEGPLSGLAALTLACSAPEQQWLSSRLTHLV